MKRIVLLMLVMCMTACQSVLPARTTETESAYSGTLRVGLFGGYQSNSGPYAAGTKPYIIQDRMKSFMEKHPNVIIEIMDLPAQPYAIRNALNDPEGLDIIEMNVHSARIAGDGMLSTLEDRIEEHLPQWDGDYAKTIDLAKIDGLPYLLPVRNDPMMVYYDRLAFAQLGLAEPQEGWTLEEFASSAVKLSEAGRSVGLPSDFNSIEHVVRGLGGAYASADNREVAGYLDSDETAEAFSRYVRMMPELVASGAVLFPNRVASMGMVRASEVHHVLHSDAGDYRIAPVPASPSGERRNTSLMTGLAITAASDQQDLAWALMSHIVGDSGEEAMDFLARNTLEVHHRVYRDEPVPRDDELRAWMKSEAAIAVPATFDLFMTRFGVYDASYPYPSQRMSDFANAAIAKEELLLAARKLESWLTLHASNEQ